MSPGAASSFSAAEVALTEGDTERALTLLEEARQHHPDARTRGKIELLGARIEMWSDGLGAHERLLTEAARVERDDRTLAAAMLAEAAYLVQGEDDELAEVLARRSIDASRRARARPAPMSLLTLANLLTVRGDTKAAERFMRKAVSSVQRGRGGDYEALFRAAANFFWFEEYAAARGLLEHLVSVGRDRAKTFLPVALDTLAAVDVRTGRLASASAKSTEALRLARLAGQDLQVASCLTTLASVEARRGLADQCRAHVDEALALASGTPFVRAYALQAMAVLELGLDRPQALIDAANSVGVEWNSLASRVVDWIPDLVEAHVRVGNRKEALRLLDEYAVVAEQTRRPTAIAAASRCRGLVSRSPEFEPHFERALELHARARTPFERARTELAYGERLRRSRRRAEARRLLAAALGGFERLGAASWAERARRELAATGGKRISADDIVALLTPHELQVAALVRKGATNKQAAGALFVSPKTIEYHLANIYAKVGVRSRTELSHFLSTNDV